MCRCCFLQDITSLLSAFLCQTVQPQQRIQEDSAMLAAVEAQRGQIIESNPINSLPDKTEQAVRRKETRVFVIGFC